MDSFLTALLTTGRGKRVMQEAENNFSGAGLADLTTSDLADWKGKVFSKVKDAYGSDVKDAASVVDSTMSAWLKSPNDITLLGNLMRAFDDLSTEMMENPAPVSRMDDVNAFKDSCFTTMSAMAVVAENASRTPVRNDSVEVAIAKARLAVTSDRLVERFGEVPDTARIGKDELPSEYWEATMGDVAPFSGAANQRILESLRTLEQSTKVGDIPKAMDQLIADVAIIDGDNKDFPGRGEMVIAEALRSEQIFPGGVYRSDQPDHRTTAALTQNEISELGETIEHRKDERDQREREEPTAGHRR